MARFYFPLLFWTPSTPEDVEAAPFALHPRRWDVSVFDLYSLVAAEFPIRMKAELMQVFLPSINVEVSIDAADYEEATRHFDALRAMLYLYGMTPTIAPFATSHSINEYAGINSRSSDLNRERLPEGLRTGITTNDSQVEGWPKELIFSVLQGVNGSYSTRLDGGIFTQATEAVTVWQEIETHFAKAAILRAALIKAPQMPDRASSVLHIWQALESAFGKGPELSFRMSLTLAELCGPIASRSETYVQAKTSYKDRSEITHGKAKSAEVDDERWMRAWGLLVTTIRSILHRRNIPTEDELFSDLLSR